MSFPDHGRVLFTATLVRGHIAKFHIPYLKWFKEQGWETWVAAKNDYPDGVCEIPFCDHFVNIDFARSPFSMQTIVAYKQLRKLFAKEHFAHMTQSAVKSHNGPADRLQSVGGACR